MTQITVTLPAADIEALARAGTTVVLAGDPYRATWDAEAWEEAVAGYFQAVRAIHAQISAQSIYGSSYGARQTRKKPLRECLSMAYERITAFRPRRLA